MSRTMGLVAGAGVLAAGGAVVVGSVAGSVVVVVVALEERVVRRTVGETARRRPYRRCGRHLR